MLDCCVGCFLFCFRVCYYEGRLGRRYWCVYDVWGDGIVIIFYMSVSMDCRLCLVWYEGCLYVLFYCCIYFVCEDVWFIGSFIFKDWRWYCWKGVGIKWGMLKGFGRFGLVFGCGW